MIKKIYMGPRNDQKIHLSHCVVCTYALGPRIISQGHNMLKVLTPPHITLDIKARPGKCKRQGGIFYNIDSSILKINSSTFG